MSRVLKFFADLPLKVVTAGPADDSASGFELSGSSPQSTPSVLTAPPEPPIKRRRDPLAEIPTWHHGGINE